MAALVAACVVVALAVFLSLFDWNLLRPALARAITAKTGRATVIHGNLKVHLWSWNPSVEVDRILLANPDWASNSTMFSAESVTVSMSLPRLLRGQLVLPLVEVTAPAINLERESGGRASWVFGSASGVPKQAKTSAHLPLIERLTIDDGHLHVVDAVRKLRFSGSIVAGDRLRDSGARPGQSGAAHGPESVARDIPGLEIHCRGSLNAQPFLLEAHGGPLQDIAPNRPYHFETHVSTAAIDLVSHVTLPKPFDMSDLDFTFVVSGEDLANLYYLTGLALPNTPRYRVSATVHVHGSMYVADDVQGRLGASDIFGDAKVQTAGARPKLTAHLTSKILDIADLAPTLGHPSSASAALALPDGAGNSAAAPAMPVAAAHSSAPRSPAASAAAASRAATAAPSVAERLLPDADLQVNRVRGMDADVHYTAAAVVAPKLRLRRASFHLVLDDGILSLDPLSFGLEPGEFVGRVQIDARGDSPISDIDMRIEDVQLEQFKSAAMKQAPFTGTVTGRVQFHGPGSSVHKFAANSDGTVAIVIPQGQINAAIAELTGINVLRGLGLLISKSETQTAIRCGVIDFDDQHGNLRSKTVYLDTSNVLITGHGDVDLGAERLNLALQGDPKKIRLLRLRSPIDLHGTLLHPEVGIDAGKLAEQAGAAVALGALLTPAAAALAFIDPGLAKNKDCSDAFAQADLSAGSMSPRAASR